MANLKDLIVTGPARFIGKIYGSAGFVGDLEGKATSAANADKVNNLTVQTAVPANAKFTDNNTTYTFAEGTTNGAFSVTPSGSNAQTVKVHGVITDISGKQDKLTPGQNITIIDNVISATGSGTDPIYTGSRSIDISESNVISTKTYTIKLPALADLINNEQTIPIDAEHISPFIGGSPVFLSDVAAGGARVIFETASSNTGYIEAILSGGTKYVGFVDDVKITVELVYFPAIALSAKASYTTYQAGNNIAISDDNTINVTGIPIIKTLGSYKNESIAVANNTWTTLHSVSVEKGTYLLIGYTSYPTNATGYRQLIIASSNTGTSGVGYGMNCSVAAASGIATSVTISAIHTMTAAGTLYLRGRQSSGTSLTTSYAVLYAVKIG